MRTQRALFRLPMGLGKSMSGPAGTKPMAWQPKAGGPELPVRTHDH